MQFLQPIWLAAMAGILVPVILHLWNDRQGNVLAIGSIALLEKRSPRRAWSRRLSEWWLLVLRCLLLIVLALLLAGPSWRRADVMKSPGWLLVDSTAVGEATNYRPLIDSLLAAGYERHVMEGEDYWGAYRAADRAAPAGSPFVVLTKGWVSRFRGVRPSSPRPVRWYTYTPVDSVRHWTAAAWLVLPDSIRVLEGSSGPTGSSYLSRILAGDPSPPVRVDTAVLRILIYTESEYRSDSRYLVAALRALGQFSRRRIQVDVTDKMPLTGGRPDWLFWLSPAPLPFGERTAHVLRYEPGKAVVVDTWLRGEPGVGIGKEIGGGAEDTVLWKDGYGRVLLGGERAERGMIYHFFSHFDPAWNGLVWSRSFPVLLSRLLFEGGLEESMDRRVLDPEQIVPLKKKEDPIGKTEGSLLDLGPVCWVLLILLFILERVVSFAAPNKR